MTDQSQREPSEDSEPAPVPADDATAVPPPPAIASAMEHQSAAPGAAVSSGAGPAPEPPAWTPEPTGPSGPAALVADRPEVAAGAAFAGGLVLALILKRLAR